MADRLQIRRDTAANWTSANPTLAQGEWGWELDTIRLKIGDGILDWINLPYFAGGGAGNVLKNTFEYSASNTFTLDEAPTDIISVNLNGQELANDGIAWTISGSDITIGYDLFADDFIQVVYTNGYVGGGAIGSAQAESIFDNRLSLQKDQDGGISANDTSILSLDTVSDLSTQNRINRTRAYVNGGGQGGNTFTYIPSGSGITADGGVYYNAADGGLWKRDYDWLPDSKWFGAIGDGVSDDTTAIQLAIDACFVLGLPLFLSAGTYIISTELDVKTSITGAGIDSILKSNVGIRVSKSNLTIDKIRVSGGNVPLFGSNGLLVIQDNVKNTKIKNCQIGDVVNTSGTYSYINPNGFPGSYAILVSQEGCQGTVISGCDIKNMHKTTVQDTVATDGFTGGVLLYSYEVLTANNASTILIENCNFENITTPGATQLDSSDAEGVRQYCQVTNDNERYGSMIVKGCTFREITKSGIKIASFSNVSISNCDFYGRRNPSNGIPTQAPIRLQYSLNSSVSDINLYGTFQYGVVANSSNVSIDGLAHSNSIKDSGVGLPHFGLGDARITNTLILAQSIIAGDYIRVSNISAMNVKQIVVAVGVNLDEKAGLARFEMSNISVTIDENGDTSGQSAFMFFRYVKSVSINQVKVLLPYSDDGSYIVDITRDSIQTIDVDDVVISGCRIPYFLRAVYIRDSNKLWSGDTRKVSILDSYFYGVNTDQSVARSFDTGIGTDTKNVQLNVCNTIIESPMVSVYGRNLLYLSSKHIQTSITKLSIIYITAGLNYPRVVMVDSGAINAIISGINCKADTDLGDLTQATSNPVVYAFNGDKVIISNIIGNYQDGVLTSSGFTNSLVSNISAFHNALILYNNTNSATTNHDGRSIRSNGVPFADYVSRATTPVGELVPRWVADVCFDTVTQTFYDAVGLTNTDWKPRS